MVHFAPFEVERWMDEYETKAKYDLAETCALSITLKELIDMSAEDGEPPLEQSALFTNKMGYGHIHGSPKLRQRIADSYDSSSKLDKENILVTQGAIGANFLAIMGIVEPNDHVVVVSPSYQQLSEVPRSFGAHVSLWHLSSEKQWEHDVEDLKALLTPKTKLVIINNPNNPTGSAISTQTLHDIHQLVQDRAAKDAMILCDEVYSPLWHSVSEDERPRSILELGLTNVLATGSLSKAYALAGLRVGWIASPRKDLLERFLGIRDYSVISVSGVDDELAARAFGERTRANLLRRNIALAQGNRAILQQWIESTPGVRWVATKGGNTALVHLGDSIDDKAFCAALCEQHKVNMVPAGLCFGLPGWVRIGYVGDTNQLKDGLALVGQFLHTWTSS